MIDDPHLYFAEISLDIARKEFQAAQNKLSELGCNLPQSYIFHLLCARALNGLMNFEKAAEHLLECCRIAPSNEVAWQELIDLKVLQSKTKLPDIHPAGDPVADELERLCHALSSFEPTCTTECYDPTPINEQKQPFPDDTSIAIPTESLANIFIAQGAYKKAIRVYTSLIQIQPSKADSYRQSIDTLLEKI